MRSPKKRSLLGVNEHFEGKRNAEIHFLFSLFYFLMYSSMRGIITRISKSANISTAPKAPIVSAIAKA